MTHRRFFCKCLDCGATGYTGGSISIQGDGVMTGEIAEVGEILDIEEWENGNPPGCKHEGEMEILSEVDTDYD